MKDYYNRYEERFEDGEHFELSLDIEDSRLSSKELRAYLLQLERLVGSINQTLNQYSDLDGFGRRYDGVSIDVLAIEHGSFKLPLHIRKRIRKDIRRLTNNPTTAIIIGEIVVHLLTSGYHNPENEAISDNCRIERNVFLENPATAKAVKEISRLAIGNDSVRNLTVVYEKGNGEREKINISKEGLYETRAFVEDFEATKLNSEIFEVEKLETENIEVIREEEMEMMEIIGYRSPRPVLRLRYRDKTILAEIRDSEYQNRSSENRYDIHNLLRHNFIIADMVAVGQGRSKKYFIIRIIGFRDRKNANLLM